MPYESNSRSVSRHLLNCVSTSSFLTANRPTAQDQSSRLAMLNTRVNSINQRFEHLQKSKIGAIQNSDVQVTRAILSLRKEKPSKGHVRFSDRQNDPFSNIQNQISVIQRQVSKQKGQNERIHKQLKRKQQAYMIERQRLLSQIDRMYLQNKQLKQDNQNRLRLWIEEIQQQHLQKMQHIQQNLQFAVTQIKRKDKLIQQKQIQIQQNNIKYNHQLELIQQQIIFLKDCLKRSQFTIQQLRHQSNNLINQKNEQQSQIQNYKLNNLQLQSLRQEIAQIKIYNSKLKDQSSYTSLLKRVHSCLIQAIQQKQHFLSQENKIRLSQEYGPIFYQWFSKIYKQNQSLSMQLEKSHHQIQKLQKSCRNLQQDCQWLCNSLLQNHDILSRFSKDSLPTTLAILRQQLQQKIIIITDKLKELRQQRCRQFSQSAPQRSQQDRLVSEVRDLKRKNHILSGQNNQLRSRSKSKGNSKDEKKDGKYNYQIQLLVMQASTIQRCIRGYFDECLLQI